MFTSQVNRPARKRLVFHLLGGTFAFIIVGAAGASHAHAQVSDASDARIAKVRVVGKPARTGCITFSFFTRNSEPQGRLIYVEVNAGDTSKTVADKIQRALRSELPDGYLVHRYAVRVLGVVASLQNANYGLSCSNTLHDNGQGLTVEVTKVR